MQASEPSNSLRAEVYSAQSTGRIGRAADRLIEPGPRDRPLALNRRRRSLQDSSRFLNRQTAKVSQLDNPALLRVNRFQLLQGQIERNQGFIRPVSRKSSDVVERNLLAAAAPLGCCVPARIVEQNSPQRLG